MKASRYNFFFQDSEGNHFIFNGLSGGLIKLSEKYRKKIQEIITNSGDKTIANDIDRKLFDHLYQGSFILDDKVDEVTILKARNRVARFSGKRLFLNVITSYRCNFRCIYCSQDHPYESMKLDVQDILVNFVNVSLKTCNELHIRWFGGEPLLQLPMIRRLSPNFMKICQANNSKYSASMSTNGFLLKKEIAAELRQLGVERVQITLDGPPDIHNKRRPLVNGQGTFETILENVVTATEYLAVTLRVNISRDNISSITELLDILKVRGLGKEVLCDFVPVTPSKNYCQSTCFSVVPDKELRDAVKRVSKESLSRGLGLLLSPLTKARGCTYSDVNSFVVNTDGGLYKCRVGEEQRVGQLNITDPKKFKLNQICWVKWTAMEPLSDPECRECRVLPLCMGGCTFKGLTFGKKSKCPVWKDSPEEYILNHVAAGFTSPIA